MDRIEEFALAMKVLYPLAGITLRQTTSPEEHYVPMENDIYLDWEMSTKPPSIEDVEAVFETAEYKALKTREESLSELGELSLKLPRHSEASVLALEGTEHVDEYLLSIAKRKQELRKLL